MSQKAAKAGRRGFEDWAQTEVARLHLEPGDYLVLHPGPTKDLPNVKAYAEQLEEWLRPRGLGPVIVVPPTSDLVALTQDQLAIYGLVRVLPSLVPGEPINWGDIEDQAHQLIRLGFAAARESIEGGNDEGT